MDERKKLVKFLDWLSREGIRTGMYDLLTSIHDDTALSEIVKSFNRHRGDANLNPMWRGDRLSVAAANEIHDAVTDRCEKLADRSLQDREEQEQDHD